MHNPVQYSTEHKWLVADRMLLSNTRSKVEVLRGTKSLTAIIGNGRRRSSTVPEAVKGEPYLAVHTYRPAYVEVWVWLFLDAQDILSK